MADSKLRMQIVTALDNAGIKATESQLKSLEGQINKINNKTDVSKLQNALGDMPGKLGKIGKSLGGIGGYLTLIVGAFTTGYEIGTMFFDKVVKGLFGWKDPIDQLIEANKKLKKQQDEEVKAWQRRANGMMAYYQQEQDMIDRSIARINSKQQTYMRLSKATSDFANAGADADIQLLERQRFEDMLQLQAAGEYDAADQADKIYNIMRKELEAKKSIAALDDDAARRDQEHLVNQQRAEKLLEKVASLEKEREKLDRWKDELDAGLNMGDIDKNQQQINARLRQIKKQIADAEKEASALADANDAYEIESNTQAVKRATLVDQLNVDRDKTLLEYDNAVNSYGNALGIQFTDEFIQQLTESSKESYDVLKDIRENTQDWPEMLKSLLQVKQ